MHLLRFANRQKLSVNSWEYTFIPDRPIEYIPGQYAHFSFPFRIHDPHFQDLQYRTFTLTSLPSDPHASIALRMPTPRSEYKNHLATLEPGDLFQMDEPMGDVILPRSDTIPLVFIAGGIGIASFIGMLRQIESSNERRDITMLYALRSETDRSFSNLLKRFPFSSYQEYLYPNRLQTQDILNAGTSEDTLFYISGAEPFVARHRAELEQRGIDHRQIIFDYFS